MTREKIPEPIPKSIGGLADVASEYDALICDIWGVLHNGLEPFAGADEALWRFREKHGRVLLLSNAPRPAESVAGRLRDIGVRDDAYDDILTSGDLARTLIRGYTKQGKAAFYVGPDKDAPLLAGLKVPLVDLSRADYVLFSGLRDDTRETPDDYRAFIKDALAQDLPLICVNPDRQVQYGERVIYCAGAVAELYERAGGEVVWLGKPYAASYERARAMLGELGGSERILAIGDGPKTDMRGAQGAGLDALFISGGLAGASGEATKTPENVAALLAREETYARWLMTHLVWEGAQG